MAAFLSIGMTLRLVTGGVTGDSLAGPETDSIPAAAFVWSETCVGCHRAQAGLWRTSQHKHAMDHATDTAVLSDFSDARFDYFGVRSRFFRENGKFLVETDGPDGKLGVFEIKYTFGLDPLQQYLVEFPDGRLQALSIAWDSRPKDQGGQRWFQLYPDEQIRHDWIAAGGIGGQTWIPVCHVRYCRRACRPAQPFAAVAWLATKPAGSARRVFCCRRYR